MGTLNGVYRSEGRTGHTPSYAKVKKMKSEHFILMV